MATPHRYQYTPLDHSKSEIRVVRIHPSNDPDAGISCTLLRQSLDWSLKYEALSYTWGAPGTPCSILLDGRPFEVTENLYACLKTLRHPIEYRDLWIDQISIDQSNISERDHEVQRMRDMYQRARRTVVWLGKENNQTRLALRLLSELDVEYRLRKSTPQLRRSFRRGLDLMKRAGLTAFDTVRSIFLGRGPRSKEAILWLRFGIPVTAFRPMESPDARVAVQLLFWFYNSFVRVFRLSYICLTLYVLLLGVIPAFVQHWIRISDLDSPRLNPSDIEVHALKEIFSRPWFRRIWIVQEIGVSKSATVVCGTDEISWTAFSNACREIRRLVHITSKPTTRYDATGFDIPMGMISSLDTKHDPRMLKREFQTLLCNFCYFQATLDVDKVYGLLGLAELEKYASSGAIFNPGYAKPLGQVYTEVVQYLVTATKTLDILRCCTGNRMVPDLPSWVPDWTIPEDKDPYYDAGFQEPFRLGDDENEPRHFPEISDDLKALIVNGFVLGHLKDTSKSQADAEFSVSLLKNAEELKALFFFFWPIYAMISYTSLALRYPVLLLARIITSYLAWAYPQHAEDIRDTFGLIAKAMKDNLQLLKAKPKSYLNVNVGVQLAASSSTSPTVGLPERRQKLMTRTFHKYYKWDLVADLPMSQWVERCGDIIRVKSHVDNLRDGDLVCLFVGANLPFILRDCGDGTYKLMGPGHFYFANSVLWALAVKGYRRGNAALQKFVIT